MKLPDIKTQVTINKHALDDELVRQPMLFLEIGDAYAEAAAKRDLAHEELKQTDAALDESVRRSFAKAKTKPTEGMIKSLILADKDHHDAVTEYLTAKAVADKLSAFKDAFQQRGYLLRDLCSLYVAGYFSDNAVRGDANTDRVHYERQREKLASARGTKIR